MADEEVRKLEKKFRDGGRVRVRVIGFRHLEGLATGALKVIGSFLQVLFPTEQQVRVKFSCCRDYYIAWYSALLSFL